MASSPGSGRLGVGLIGAGCIGIEHIRNLLLLPTAAVVAIADTHQPSRQAAVEVLSSAGRLEGVSVLDDYTKLLALPEVDAIFICTPNYHHAEVLRLVMRAGKHCLVEKPLAITIDDCAQLVTAESRLGLPKPLLWCAMEYRYIPPIARLIEQADSGVIGQLRMLTIRENRFPFLRKVGDWNRFNAKSGGTLVEKCCHFFDLMRRILRSEPRRLFGSGGQDLNHLAVNNEEASSPRPDIMDNAYVIVEFESGARAMLELCMFAEASKHQEEVTLIGALGKLEAFAPSHGQRKDDEQLVNFRRGIRNPIFARGEWDRAEPPAPEECGSLFEQHVQIDAQLLQVGNHAGATYEELRRFSAAAHSGSSAEVSLADGAKAVLMGIAAQRSISTGAPIMWADVLREYQAFGM